MPATVTHAYFSNDVYDILPNQIKERISLSRIKMFGQGTDPFMFYHLFVFCQTREKDSVDATCLS